MMIKLVVGSMIVTLVLADFRRGTQQINRRLPRSITSPQAHEQIALLIPTIIILKQIQDYYPNGGYYFAYETTNGITAEERGTFYPDGPGKTTKTVQGKYGYTSPEGVPVSVTYNADKNGYRPMTRLGNVGGGGASRPRMNK